MLNVETAELVWTDRTGEKTGYSNEKDTEEAENGQLSK